MMRGRPRRALVVSRFVFPIWDESLCLLHGFDFVSEASKLGQSRKIALVGCDDGDSLARRTHGDEGIIGQSSPANLLVIVLNGKPSQHLASL